MQLIAIGRKWILISTRIIPVDIEIKPILQEDYIDLSIMVGELRKRDHGKNK